MKNADIELALIGHFSTVEEAYMVVAKLDAAGLKAMVGPHRARDLIPMAFASQGVPVMIDKAHLEAAIEALQNDEPEAL